MIHHREAFTARVYIKDHEDRAVTDLREACRAANDDVPAIGTLEYRRQIYREAFTAANIARVLRFGMVLGLMLCGAFAAIGGGQ